jgi:hypothetical protein
MVKILLSVPVANASRARAIAGIGVLLKTFLCVETLYLNRRLEARPLA